MAGVDVLGIGALGLLNVLSSSGDGLMSGVLSIYSRLLGGRGRVGDDSRSILLDSLDNAWSLLLDLLNGGFNLLFDGGSLLNNLLLLDGRSLLDGCRGFHTVAVVGRTVDFGMLGLRRANGEKVQTLLAGSAPGSFQFGILGYAREGVLTEGTVNTMAPMIQGRSEEPPVGVEWVELLRAETLAERMAARETAARESVRRAGAERENIAVGDGIGN